MKINDFKSKNIKIEGNRLHEMIDVQLYCLDKRAYDLIDIKQIKGMFKSIINYLKLMEEFNR